MALALSLRSRSRLAFRPCDLSEKAPRLLLPLSEPPRSEATSHQLVAEITTGPTSCHVQGEKILIGIAFKRSFKDRKVDFDKGNRSWGWGGGGVLLGVEVGRGLVAQALRTPEPAGAASVCERLHTSPAHIQGN